MDNQNLPSWLQSSTGEGIALRWKAIAAGALPVLLLVLPYLGIHITAEAFGSLIEGVYTVIISVWAVLSGVAFVYGWIRNYVFKNESLGKYARGGR